MADKPPLEKSNTVSVNSKMLIIGTSLERVVPLFSFANFGR